MEEFELIKSKLEKSLEGPIFMDVEPQKTYIILRLLTLGNATEF